MAKVLKKIKFNENIIEDVQLCSEYKTGKTLASLSVNGEFKGSLNLNNINLKDITFEHDLSLIGDYTLGLKKTSTSEIYVISAGTNLYDALSILFAGSHIEEYPIKYFYGGITEDQKLEDLTTIDAERIKSLQVSSDDELIPFNATSSTIQFVFAGDERYLSSSTGVTFKGPTQIENVSLEDIPLLSCLSGENCREIWTRYPDLSARYIVYCMEAKSGTTSDKTYTIEIKQ